MIIVFVVFLLSSCIDSEKVEGQSYSQISGYLEIKMCFFLRHKKYNGNGGVIFLDKKADLMVIECTFFNCIAKWGGAIYFIGDNSALSKVCANRCLSDCYHFAEFDSYKKCKIDLLSYTQCSNNTNFLCAIMLNQGNQHFHGVNSSYNKASIMSCLLSQGSSNLSCGFCNFFQNVDSQGRMMSFESGTNIRNIYLCNLVQNKPESNQGLIFIYSQYVFSDCIFMYNSFTLFKVLYGTLLVKNSHVVHQSTFNSGSIVTENIHYSKTDLYPLEFYGTNKCQTPFFNKNTNRMTEYQFPLFILFSILIK